jgi:glycosyltransferase involved in cell wall biosynthesis
LKLLFVSNLFPDKREPQRGLDNATLLTHLSGRDEIRAVAVRPVLPWSARQWEPREAERRFLPRYVATPYVPKIGSAWNHRLMARALRTPLREIHEKFPFDAVLASWLYPDACAVALLAREMGFPFAAIAQGSDAHQYLAWPARRQIMLACLPQASAIITRSAELARLLRSAGLPAEQVHPIYNGVDTTRYQPGDQATARHECRLPADGRIVLFVGNFFAIKNPLLLLAAHARLRETSESGACHLVLLGGGPLERPARALAARLGTTGQVHFVGRQEPARVARYMQAADVLAVPSRNEGVPNVILEAFACGLPVVATHVGGIPEVLTHDFLGRLVAPENVAALAEGLGAVLEAPPWRARIGAYAQRFSWTRTAEAYHDLLAGAVR